LRLSLLFCNANAQIIGSRALQLVLTTIGLVSTNVCFAFCGEQFSSTARQLIEMPNFTIAYEPSVWPIPVGKHFSVQIQVCSKTPTNLVTGLKIDADMPAHKHGMNYKPSLTKQSESTYLAQGLMFHMPGQWRMLFEFESSDNPGQKIRANREHRIE
jgi:hypothetical protein